jgi:hypothetical protein
MCALKFKIYSAAIITAVLFNLFAYCWSAFMDVDAVRRSACLSAEKKLLRPEVLQE